MYYSSMTVTGSRANATTNVNERLTCHFYKGSRIIILKIKKCSIHEDSKKVQRRKKEAKAKE